MAHRRECQKDRGKNDDTNAHDTPPELSRGTAQEIGSAIFDRRTKVEGDCFIEAAAL
jgi:hypothetical protein